MNRYSPVFIFLFLLQMIAIQAIPLQEKHNDLYFGKLPENSILQSTASYSMVQDDYGFLWIGGAAGLFRYDGYHTQLVSKDGVNISANCLLNCKDYILAGTDYGLFKIDVETREIESIPTAGNNAIRSLTSGEAGHVWAGTDSGLLKIMGDSITEYNTLNSAIAHNMICCLLYTSGNCLWIGTQNGLNKLSAGGVFTYYNLKGNYKPELDNNLVKDIKEGPDSMLFIGTETGLALFDRRTEQFEVIHCGNSSLSNEVIKCVHVRQDQVWLGTDFGLNAVDLPSRSVRSYFHESFIPHTLSNNVIQRIFEDKRGTVWLLTDRGVNYQTGYGDKIHFVKTAYSYMGKTIGMQIRSLNSSGNTLYLATGNGIITVDTETKQANGMSALNRRLLMPNTNDVMKDRFGRLWIATTGGMNIYNPKTAEMDSYTRGSTPVSLFNSNYMASIRSFGAGSVFVSIWQDGIYRIDEKLGLDKGIAVTHLNNYATHLFVASDTYLWFVMNGKLRKTNLVNGAEDDVKEVNRFLDGKYIYALYISGNVIYIGTEGGVARYLPAENKVEFLTINTDEAVINIVEDRQGWLWGSGNRSLFCISEAGKTLTVALDREFPLRNIRAGCMAVDERGTVYCGGADGFLWFNPGELDMTHFKPQIYITELKVNNKDIALGTHASSIELNSDERNLSFGFASLPSGASSVNRYRYKMEGVDKEWIITRDEQDAAVYSNLPYGNYIFRVQGIDNYGQWVDGGASLKIKIHPPLLLHPVSITMYVLLALTLIYIFFRLYIHRLQLQNELRIEKMDKEFTRRITDSKLQFFTNISHDFRTPLSLIIPPLKEVLAIKGIKDEQRRLIDIAYANSEKLMRLINRLLDFRKMDTEKSLNAFPTDIIAVGKKCYEMFADNAQRMNIRYGFVSGYESLTINCDQDKMESVIYNLLSNAFKFSANNGLIELSIKLDGNEFVLSVSDTGAGIHQKDISKIFHEFYRSEETEKHITGSGVGLAIVKSYVELHGGTVEVSSVYGKGSTFTVRIPVTTKPSASIVEVQPATSSKKADALEAAMNDSRDKPLILYVEDNADMVEYIKLSLGKKYNIVSAADGKEGYEKCQNLLPELVITDVMMPGTDGLDMSRMLKDNLKTRHIPIIILTAKSLMQDQIDGLKAGIDTYLVKPVHPEVIEANIEKILARRRQMEEYFHDELLLVSKDGANRKDIDKKLVDDIIDLIEKHISDTGLSVEFLSSRLGISAAHLFRRIKTLTGLSTNELIRKYRLKKASLLIKNNQGSISEIMFHTGFTSSSYFSKCFKKEFGVPPGEFKSS